MSRSTQYLPEEEEEEDLKNIKTNLCGNLPRYNTSAKTKTSKAVIASEKIVKNYFF